MTIGEGLAGALYWKSFVDIAKEIGFSGPYLITSRNMSCDNEEFAKILGIKLINLYLNSIYILCLSIYVYIYMYIYIYKIRRQTWITSYELYFTTNLFRMTRRVLPHSSGEFK
jgi:hypothetical protein